MYKDANITIAFEGDRVYGFSGVNRYFGGAKIDGENIEVLNVASTMMAGPENRMQAESGYIKLLNEADKIEVKNDSIILLTKDNEKLIFEKK